MKTLNGLTSTHVSKDNDMIDNKTQKQLKLILRRLIALKEKKISLKEFTSVTPYYFPEMFDCLNIDDDEWFDKCNREWWEIEIVYSCYKRPTLKYEDLNEFDKKFIEEKKDDIKLSNAINNLIKLVKSKINKEDE